MFKKFRLRIWESYDLIVKLFGFYFYKRSIKLDKRSIPEVPDLMNS